MYQQEQARFSRLHNYLGVLVFFNIICEKKKIN